MMTNEERTETLRKANDNLRAAGFDNVVILVNEGGSQGMISISAYAKPALMRLLLASYFMDKTMAQMASEDSTGMILWKSLLRSLLKTIVPQIQKLEEENRDKNRVSKIVSFGIGKD